MRVSLLPAALLAAAALGSCGRRDTDEKPGLVVEVERLAASKSRSPEEVRPYDESLSWHEYRVRRVVSGVLDAPVIRVAHWTVLGGRAVPLSTRTGEVSRLRLMVFEVVEGLKGVNRSDDLEIVAEEPPRFLDLSQPLPPKVAVANERMDYGGNFSEQMRLYWRLRPQLRLVVMGNSHATKGIATPLLCGEENRATPVAFNLAPPGGDLELQCLLVREYVLPLPRIEWLVWVASPRLFNGRSEDSRKARQFAASPGRAHDVARRLELWPVPDGPPVTAEELSPIEIGVDAWGWEGRRKTLLSPDPAEARAQIRKDMLPEDFEFSEARWRLFVETLRAVRERGVRVLLVHVPMHPLLRDWPVGDLDGTPHAGVKDLTRRFAELDAGMSGLWFRDFNLGGAHDFPHESFYDGDHLNRSGARELTRRIAAWMEECAREPSPVRGDAPAARD